jgi:tetratricopeptide (TPR) repeat protein
VAARMDLYFQGRAWSNRGPTREYMERARSFFERALVLDPEHAEALVGIAAIDGASAASHMVDDRRARFATAEAILIKALSIAPEHARAHLWLGNVRLFTNRATQGISECERALRLNRNLAEAHSSIGAAKVLIGRSAETEAHVQFDRGSARWPAMGHGKHTPRGHVPPHPAAERRHSVVSLARKPTGEQASGREFSSGSN